MEELLQRFSRGSQIDIPSGLKISFLQPWWKTLSPTGPNHLHIWSTHAVLTHVQQHHNEQDNRTMTEDSAGPPTLLQ